MMNIASHHSHSYKLYCTLSFLYVHPSTVPGGPPENFTVDVVSSTQIQLTWQPPPQEIQNGLVRLFIVSVSEIQTNTTYSYTLRSQPSEDLTWQLESLHPFYEYVCSVAAVTIGPGPDTSPLRVKTFEDGKCLPFFG